MTTTDSIITHTGTDTSVGERDGGPSTGATYALAPISAADANALRAAGGQCHVADAVPGFPCRQCLRDAAIGDELILVSHDPFDQDSPYRSASPIFLHAQDCVGPDPAIVDGSTPAPDQLTVRRLAVRAFDPDAMMVDATLIEGTALAATIDAFFANPTVEHAQVYFAERGCWATRVARTGP